MHGTNGDGEFALLGAQVPSEGSHGVTLRQLPPRTHVGDGGDGVGAALRVSRVRPYRGGVRGVGAVRRAAVAAAEGIAGHGRIGNLRARFVCF